MPDVKSPDPSRDFILLAAIKADAEPTAAPDTIAEMSFPGAILVAYATIDPTAPGGRSLSDVSIYTPEALEEAAADCFKRMDDTGLAGHVDAADVRLVGTTPLDLTERMTTHIWDLIDAENEAEGLEERVDDFDYHPLAYLREAMVDACPAYNGLPATAPEGP